jgi:membrane protein implicated in regulation of membrane protease activity
MLQPELFWLIIGILLMILELLTPGFVLLFFGVGALFTALVVLLVPETAIAVQLGSFLFVSLAILFLLRARLQKRFGRTIAGEDDGRGDPS